MNFMSDYCSLSEASLPTGTRRYSRLYDKTISGLLPADHSGATNLLWLVIELGNLNLLIFTN
jgi:hypothetical protein